ncbi:translation initiation factor IF-2, mitochondrial [Corythoichthys intestinalis]|uniref:translation initiation factor IF-2, mitochondrial n=1 Tax=Corythoichthys intestinalis TaxID=161448 RepID=UPI0025A6004B|nr:translation initiation factor IF-2, mitochondrial [Corythoichthys intestinalis]XP_061792124.1 translation initiation factor IF-2, mitochondrial-like [Nerophis lumbriciformis]
MLRVTKLASRVAAHRPWRRPVCGGTPLLASDKVKGQKKERKPEPKAEKQEVEIRRTMTVEALARAMNRHEDDVLEALVNTALDVSSLHSRSVLEERWIKEAVKLSGMKFRWEKLSEPPPPPRQDRDAVPGPPDEAGRMAPRPPVVTVMGHVDHGKTTLLDALRKSQVAASEAGGITQHIGAFGVELPTGERMTFLDTPGHAAFSAMRARGALATDIVVLVVAADDGVMTQTAESIRHAKSAGVPVIVAINKCDKADADPERVKRELLAHDVVCEDLGGDVQAVPVSALTGHNLGALAEAVAALAEVLEIKARHDGAAEGLVIESRTDKGKGPVTTALVQRGTLRRGCVLVAGKTWAKVRSLTDDRGRSLEEALPGTAAEVVGWREAPSAGDTVLEVESERRAREVSEWRLHREASERLTEEESVVSAERQRHREAYEEERARLAHLTWRQRRVLLYRRDKTAFARRPSEKTGAPEGPRLALVVKADVDGSLEAIVNILDTYDAENQCQLDVVHVGVGDISETDVNMAQTFGGSVYGFNVSASKSVLRTAARHDVPVKTHAVIYKMMDELKADISGRLPPRVTHEVLGEAAVLAVFDVTAAGKKKTAVAGCRVLKGQLERKMKFRLLRGEDVLWEGGLLALKHHKDDVSTVKSGTECGLSLDGEAAFQPGDVIQCFREAEVPQVTAWDPGF